MSIMNYCALILLLTSIYFKCSRVSGQYHITEGYEPRYLYHKFDNVEEEIFPRIIRIKISLSSITGTLLYSIDRNMNQLIVSLQESPDPIMNIEFRGNSSPISIADLCKCTLCKYEILDLWIQIMSGIEIKCNSRITRYIEYGARIDINTGYPNPFSKIDNKSSLNNEAHLWLVNHLMYDNIYPNYDQLSGCIFYVQYKNENVLFTSISDNINKKCIPACTGKVCNGGQCFETYDESPVCNCTSTFRNGPYCNDSMTTQNYKLNNADFKFTNVKVSWKLCINDILRIENRLDIIHLRTDGRIVKMEYNYTNNISVIAKAKLFSTYNPNAESIFIANFKDRYMDIQFHNDGSWSNIKMPTPNNLQEIKFESFTLTSGTGVIDISFKVNERDVKWNHIYIFNPNFLKPMISILNKEINATENQLNDELKSCQVTNNVLIPIICALVVFNLLWAVGIILIFRKEIMKKIQQLLSHIFKEMRRSNKKDSAVVSIELTQTLINNQTPNNTSGCNLHSVSSLEHRAHRSNTV